MKFHFMQEHQCQFRITAMSRVLGVSRSGYYAWRTRPASPRACTNARLLSRIRTIHAEAKENYGAVKTWRALTALGDRLLYNRQPFKGAVFVALGLVLSWLTGRAVPTDPQALARPGAALLAPLVALLAVSLWSVIDAWRVAGR